MKYMADDGTVFSTEAECLAYENNPMKQLTALVKDKIDWSYSDVAGIQIIEESAVLNFIVSHIDEINKILKTKNETSVAGEWISNIGHNREWHPKALKGNTKTEVTFRDGEAGYGRADYWESSWKETDNTTGDIIAYRII